MTHRSFADARRALEAGETTCEALVTDSLSVIDDRNDRINAFLSVDAEGALEAARALDDAHADGEPLPPLAGMVMGIKDVLAVQGRPLTCASRMLGDFESLYTATAVERLFEAGAVSVGKLNCDEFAMGSSNENSAFGPVRNPIDEERVPGGSSGGSAAAVAAGMVHATLGTDTGGSIRLPAAFTGTVGLKPTYGRVSRFGLVAFASSFDSIGPLAHSVEDAAAILQEMAGADANDSTCAPVKVPDYRAALTENVSGLRVGLPREFYEHDGLDVDIRRLLEREVDRLRDAGAEIVDVSLPHTEYGIATYYVLTTAEASSNLSRYDGVRYGHRADLEAIRTKHEQQQQQAEAALAEAAISGDDEALTAAQAALDGQPGLLERFYTENRTEGFGAEVKRRIMLGTYVLSAGYYDAYYGTAQRVRSLIRQDFEQAYEKADVLLTPASPTLPFTLGERRDPLQMYLADVYTVTASLAGVPGLVVPTQEAHPSGLPVGVQILGRAFDEATVLRVGDALMRP